MKNKLKLNLEDFELLKTKYKTNDDLFTVDIKKQSCELRFYRLRTVDNKK